MTIPIYQADAFTSHLFGGNPAAICPLTEWLPDEVMQKIAVENNLAETAFFEVMRSTEGFLFKTPEDRYRDMIEKHPDIFNSVPLYHIASYLGIQGPSLSRIRKRMVGK